MKIVIPGGSGQVGRQLVRAFAPKGHEVVILGRRIPSDGRIHGVRAVAWDGETLGAWADELDGADVVVNLAGRSVNCRYTDENLRAMMDSRVKSARVVGEAIAGSSRPVPLWLQMSTATIYAHRYDAPNDEATGVLGGEEPGVPAYWEFSVRIAKCWEAAQTDAPTPNTRRVALRASLILSPDRGGIFDVLHGLVRLRLGGPVAGGRQWVSWIHEADFVGAVRFLIAREDLEGPIIVAAPNPLPQREFMRTIRRAMGVRVGLPATAWMATIGAVVMRSDTELLLKSRRVVPGRLLDAGYRFAYPELDAAAHELVGRRRAG